MREAKGLTYTFNPGESSVYNFNIVLDEPPAPAALAEFGLDTCESLSVRRLNMAYINEILLSIKSTTIPNCSTMWTITSRCDCW